MMSKSFDYYIISFEKSYFFYLHKFVSFKKRLFVGTQPLTLLILWEQSNKELNNKLKVNKSSRLRE